MDEYDQPDTGAAPNGPEHHPPIAVEGVTPPTRFATFRRRVNRFVVEVDLIDGEYDSDRVRVVTERPTTASMSNPGRMQEILLSGARLGLVPGPKEGRHPWRVVSFHRNDLTVPIDTVTANRVARSLIHARRIPSLRDWDIARSEVTRRGGSRFDFLLRRRGVAEGRRAADEERYLEVKSCSLFNGSWALFPDAVTARGRRHVEELAGLGNGVVLFVVNSGDVDRFSPDFHVDLAFARTLVRSRRSLEVAAVGVRWTPDLTIEGPIRELSIPWDRIEAQLDDTGSYLVLMGPALVEPALKYLQQRGVVLSFNQRLRHFDFEGGRVAALAFARETIALGPGDQVILALPPPAAQALLPDLAAPLECHAIVNAHIRLPEAPAWTFGPPAEVPFLGLLGGTADWLFLRDDVVSLTVSAASKLAERPNEEIAERLWTDTAKAFGLDARERPPIRVINEKRATFAQTPAALKQRPGPRTAWRNLFLAGDWTDTGLPATIESAVRSGESAAAASSDAP